MKIFDKKYISDVKDKCKKYLLVTAAKILTNHRQLRENGKCA